MTAADVATGGLAMALGYQPGPAMAEALAAPASNEGVAEALDGQMLLDTREAARAGAVKLPSITYELPGAAT